jgi:hypothetical protein
MLFMLQLDIHIQFLNDHLFRWAIHSRAIDETLTIEINSCTIEDDAFVTVAATRGLLDLLQ